MHGPALGPGARARGQSATGTRRGTFEMAAHVAAIQVAIIIACGIAAICNTKPALNRRGWDSEIRLPPESLSTPPVLALATTSTQAGQIPQ